MGVGAICGHDDASANLHCNELNDAPGSLNDHGSRKVTLKMRPDSSDSQPALSLRRQQGKKRTPQSHCERNLRPDQCTAEGRRGSGRDTHEQAR